MKKKDFEESPDFQDIYFKISINKSIVHTQRIRPASWHFLLQFTLNLKKNQI